LRCSYSAPSARAQTTDKRANPKTIKIESSVGNLQVWQATAWELEQLVALGLRRKAKQHKIILRAMMGVAVRHGAVGTNPIDDVTSSLSAKRKHAARSRISMPCPAFSAHVRAWPTTR
jgi:hypothetical protein